MPAVTTTATLTLVNRRANAVADFWRCFVEVREPTELMAVQMSYWNQLVDDYQDAYTEGLAQLTVPMPNPALETAEPAPLARSA